MSELPEKQVKRLKSLIQDAETNLAAAKELLISILGEDDQVVTPRNSQEDVTGKVVEGVFDGQMMIGPDGKNYPVPANYASKSKLVEGDMLKLTIADGGGFIYKQIGPTERRQIIGTLVQHDGAYYVEAGGREYRILLASVTYFRINVGDQVTIIIPEDNPAHIFPIDPYFKFLFMVLIAAVGGLGSPSGRAGKNRLFGTDF